MSSFVKSYKFQTDKNALNTSINISNGFELIFHMQYLNIILKNKPIS
jgi:hypothetical protein